MDNLPINTFDVILLSLLIVSSLIGLMRGFIREVLSLGSWVAGAWVTLNFFDDCRRLLQNYIESDVIAGVAAVLLLFTASLIGFSLASRFISKVVQSIGLIGPVDRSLGFFFGLTRGAMLICVGYIVTLQMVPAQAKEPDWVTGSVLLPQVAKLSELLQKAVPGTLVKPSDYSLARLKAQMPDSRGETGYTSEQNLGLDRLFEGLQNK